MQVTYYPGCSLEGTARDYAASLTAVCKALGVELIELEDWNCCGATAAHALNHHAAIALAGRNLALAEKEGRDLVVPCPLCFNRLKTAAQALTGDKRQSYDYAFQGDIKIYDLADFLAQEPLLQLLASRVSQPLPGLKAVCYYGCMASRPPGITEAPDHENPTSMDRILSKLGVEVKPWSYKTDCCGASHLIARRDIVFKLVGRLYDKAVEAGANCMVVSCQMCQANLDLYQDKILRELERSYYLPIFYFTELIGLALGLSQARQWGHMHFVPPARLLAGVGLISC
ncbi:MAG: CoB--CoM heterodisulfide reductase iron-sulfur subunit B family protein [Desulfobacca sp.]|nr:CoB--CoM heterodisulfide reductase iron-sulfur subunit B family protein [Desulfobacca sp.]